MKNPASSVSRRGLLLAAGALAAGLAPLAPSPARAKIPRAGQRRVLTVYYTRTGHTRTLAEFIHARVGGDLVRVETAAPYPDDYEQTVEQARRERDTDDWPALATRIADIASYDVVFLGSPIWGDNLNPPMKRFLADHDLSGKTIAPFATYIVSRMGQMPDNIGRLAPGATLLEGLPVLGEKVSGADGAVSDWLRRIGLA